jgi:hypothetical protein
MTIRESYYKNKGLGINLHEGLSEERPEDFIYNKNSWVQSETGIKKALVWVVNNIDNMLGYVMGDGPDPDYSKNRVKWNRKVVRNAITNKYGEDVANSIEQKYRKCIIDAANQLGQQEHVYEELDNFGKISIESGYDDITDLARKLMNTEVSQDASVLKKSNDTTINSKMR